MGIGRFQIISDCWQVNANKTGLENAGGFRKTSKDELESETTKKNCFYVLLKVW